MSKRTDKELAEGIDLAKSNFEAFKAFQIRPRQEKE